MSPTQHDSLSEVNIRPNTTDAESQAISIRVLILVGKHIFTPRKALWIRRWRRNLPAGLNDGSLKARHRVEIRPRQEMIRSRRHKLEQ